MAFVNEYISEEDSEKYGIKEIDRQFIVGGTHDDSWTIDHERNIYLRCVARGREEFRHQSTWTFYWHGELLVVRLDTLDAGGKRGGHIWVHQKLQKLEVPQHLESKRDEIISDLRDALIAYKGSGVFSTATKYTHTLDIL